MAVPILLALLLGDGHALARRLVHVLFGLHVHLERHDAEGLERARAALLHALEAALRAVRHRRLHAEAERRAAAVLAAREPQPLQNAKQHALLSSCHHRIYISFLISIVSSSLVRADTLGQLSIPLSCFAVAVVDFPPPVIYSIDVIR